ncbi:MAG: YihY family inner membrane protein [Phycisphaeraceae bacterium]|nr:MAG: YihY family inner membrane protein [Phycisphaeraceae bacterium]
MAKNRVHRVLDAALREREEWRRTLEVVRKGLRGLVKSQIPRMGAAMAYRTLFSLIPVLVVGVSVLGSFLSDAELRTQMDRLIDFVGLNTIAIDEKPAGNGEVAPRSGNLRGDTSSTDDAQPPLAGPGITLDGSSARLDEWIASLVNRVSRLPFRAIGFVGVLVLLYGAISMLVELERSFNQIYGATSGRSWVKRVTTYWTTLTLGIVFLLATFSVGDVAGNWVASLGSDGASGGGWLSRGVVEFVVNVVINTLLMLIAYSTVPNARVHIRPALAGAAVAGVAWEIGKIAFTQYVRHAVGGLEQLYGVLALLPLFMLWVYVTWVIVLFGLQVSYALQTFGNRMAESAGPVSGLVDPALMLVIARLAADRFATGQILTLDDAASATGVSEDITRQFILGLVRSGVLREVEAGEEPAFLLGRPAESITVPELLAIGRAIRQGGVRGGAPEADAALDRSMQGLVLSELQIPGGSTDAPRSAPESPSGRARTRPA